MAVRVVIGDYHVNNTAETIVSQFTPDCVRKTKLNRGKRIVLYAEALGLTKTDFEFIAKNATADVVIICETKKTMNGVRKTKRMTIDYSEGYCEEANPFDVAKMILTLPDRAYVYGFLSTNRVPMFMVVKAMISASPDCKNKTNIASIAWLDQNLYRVRPEMLYAYASYMIKPEKYLRFIKWRFPKKKDDGETK